MAEAVTARGLLRRAAAIYEGPDSGLREGAAAAAGRLFASGGRWMQAALEQLRAARLPGARFNLNALGFLKYALAGLGALSCVALAWRLEEWWWGVFAVPVFYAIEVQMVFLFPIALEGEARPFRTALGWTRRAGGTLAAMRVVLPLAAVMLLGGVCGRGFVRCWCFGCLAVCLWYEDLRLQALRQELHARI